MILGLRVVRGPDWDKGNQDGGQDHVGTVSRVINDHVVQVVWDMGETTMCRVGEGGKHDVIVFDNAPLGQTHQNVGCESCEEICITGTLWKCKTCVNVNLCTVCYYDDGHVTDHPFQRIDFPGNDPVDVPKRSTSVKSRSLGIFPSAEVVRGKDWEYANQDGGQGRVGVVEDVISFGKDVSSRNAVRVCWPNGQKNTYRLGYKGLVDLRCTEEVPGPDFYRAHLAIIDPSRVSQTTDTEAVLSVGDRVCVHVSKSELRNLQLGRLVWNTRMEEVVGEIGILRNTTIEGHLEVEFDGDVLMLNKGAVVKVPEFKKGDKVRAVQSKDLMKRLQRNHGGWDDDMIEILGKEGVVTVIDRAGDVGVMFGEVGFVFHPNCLTHVQDGRFRGGLEREYSTSISLGDAEEIMPDDQEEEEEEETSSDEEEKEEEKEEDGEEAPDSGDGFLQMFAGLVLLQALSEATVQTSDNKEEFLNAVLQGRVDDVERMLQANASLCQLTYRGLPTLHLATHQGHASVVSALLKAGIPIDVRDNEKKNTALIVAIAADKEDVTEVLLARGADVNCQNIHGRTALHIASNKNKEKLVKALLERNANPNCQDITGDTALHDAIVGTHNETAALLIDSPRMDLSIQNKKSFNPMAFACLKGHHFALDRILTKDMSLVTCKGVKGFFPIHIAAINNHINETTTLIIKGRADVNVKNDNGTTPLHLACSEAFFDMVKLLLTYEADWTITDNDKDTPLHSCMAGRRTDSMFLAMLGLRNLAEDNERIKIANFLIQHGARVDVTNLQGKTPITVCGNERIREAVTLYAAQNKPTKPERRQTRPKTAKVAEQAFTTFNQKCHKCASGMSSVRFLPCKHTISCAKCCYKYKHCPICEREITSRVDKVGKPVGDSTCVIS